MVRAKVGPVAHLGQPSSWSAFRTRVGKILRGTMQKIADGDLYATPATIDDAASSPRSKRPWPTSATPKSTLKLRVASGAHGFVMAGGAANTKREHTFAQRESHAPLGGIGLLEGADSAPAAADIFCAKRSILPPFAPRAAADAVQQRGYSVKNF